MKKKVTGFFRKHFEHLQDSFFILYGNQKLHCKTVADVENALEAIASYYLKNNNEFISIRMTYSLTLVPYSHHNDLINFSEALVYNKRIDSQQQFTFLSTLGLLQERASRIANQEMERQKQQRHSHSFHSDKAMSDHHGKETSVGDKTINMRMR